MIRFEVARLLDEPELNIFTFFPDYCSHKAGTSVGENFTIYVVRDCDEVFYVGKSDDDCFVRLRSHIGRIFRGRKSVSLLGSLIQRNLPKSRQWSVELYTNEDTKEIIKMRFYKGFSFWPTEYAEAAMIQTLKPYLNQKLNTRDRREIPERYR
ncbi:MAG TPA: hypothetical protein VGO67_05285 [Verrucomicrobiae bacterium]|jgi:hypothetical protein